MEQIGIGVVGIGWVSSEHIRSYRKNSNCRVVALCSRSRERAQAQAADTGLGEVQIYERLEEILADPAISAISICTRPDTHPEVAIAAARAGKHLLIEKAAANDPASLGKMLQAVQEAGVKTVVSFVLRWNPQFQWIRAMLDKEAIGPIYYAETDYWHHIGPQYSQYRWNVTRKAAGSVLLSAGCHAVDAIRYFVQSDVETVSAFANKRNPEYEYDTNLVGILRFQSGAIGKVSASFDAKCPYQFNIDLLGEDGAIRDNRIFAQEFFAGQNDWITTPLITPSSGDVSHHPFDGEINHFIDCIRSNSESHVNLADAVKTHAICFALDRSASEQRTVTVAEIDREIYGA
ncbi:MAG: Gfo/Idh/MocA family oxidoreductase [Armatimonadetes bacterium]|nr:Gfo/Idh/MocA family oxidoreductase [Armatimonadota bacterium]MDE2207743.1 Gfo/Idh/MocA family oxidoreductase [Armatimonadota bacterium]